MSRDACQINRERGEDIRAKLLALVIHCERVDRHFPPAVNIAAALNVSRNSVHLQLAKLKRDGRVVLAGGSHIKQKLKAVQ